MKSDVPEAESTAGDQVFHREASVGRRKQRRTGQDDPHQTQRNGAGVDQKQHHRRASLHPLQHGRTAGQIRLQVGITFEVDSNRIPMN